MKKGSPVLIKRFCCIFIALLFLPCFSQASSWKTYPYQDPKSAIVFPTDEGSHLTTGNLSNTNLEWWYFVIHAVGQTTGDKYAIVVDSVNNGGRFFTITNLTKNTHASATWPGTLSSPAGSLNLQHTTNWGTDYMRNKKDASGNLIPFEYEFETKGGPLPLFGGLAMNIKGSLVSQKPPMMAGGTGYVSIGYAGESWYYSLTRLTVNAVLTFNGTTENITGQGWFDHQWGPFKLSPYESADTGFETYEWFCVQFDDNSEMMISNVYDLNNNLPYGTKYGGVQYYDPDGVSTYAPSTLTRTGYWYDSGSGYYMSMGWKLDVPETYNVVSINDRLLERFHKNIKLKLTPESTNQMVTIPLHSNGNFFEGSLAVTGTVGDVAVTGKGFGELLHRFKIPSLSVTVNNYPAKSTYATNETIQVSWVVNNPDAGNPLKYDVELVSANSRISIAKGIKTNTVAYTLGSTIPAGTFRIKVTAYSVDKVLQSNVFSPYLTKLQ